MRNLGRKINESFDKYLEKIGATTLTEAANSKRNESSLNEAVPRDLMNQIKRTGNYRQRDKDKLLGNDYVSMDYQSADMREITADDVLQMRKNKEPLDDIYILKNGRMIKLMGGKPAMYDGSDHTAKRNQSLKKSLEGADKIYIGKIQPFSETNPKEYALRKSQYKTRRNMDFAGDDSRYARRENRYADEMIRGEHDDDFLRTPNDDTRLYRANMEKRNAQRDRDRAANNRYYDSNATNRVPKFKILKDKERWAKSDSANAAQQIKELKAHKKQSDARAKQSRDEINKMLRK